MNFQVHTICLISAWNFLLASDGGNNNDEEDVMLMCSQTCSGSYKYCVGGLGCCQSCSPGAPCISTACSYEFSDGNGENNVVGRDMVNLD